VDQTTLISTSESSTLNNYREEACALRSPY
jgi:hypothetical protein